MGNTTDTDIRITGATSNNVNITVFITISFSSAFRGSAPGTNIETQNPGREREVKAHEEGHRDQIMAAANKSITISVRIDGKKTKFSGSADQVIVDATAAFKRSIGATNMSVSEKSDFINNNIGLRAINKMSKNIDKAVKASKKLERDANNKAAAALGASTIRYNNGLTPIIFNGIRF